MGNILWLSVLLDQTLDRERPYMYCIGIACICPPSAIYQSVYTIVVQPPERSSISFLGFLGRGPFVVRSSLYSTSIGTFLTLYIAFPPPPFFSPFWLEKSLFFFFFVCIFIAAHTQRDRVYSTSEYISLFFFSELERN